MVSSPNSVSKNEKRLYIISIKKNNEKFKAIFLFGIGAKNKYSTLYIISILLSLRLKNRYFYFGVQLLFKKKLLKYRFSFWCLIRKVGSRSLPFFVKLYCRSFSYEFYSSVENTSNTKPLVDNSYLGMSAIAHVKLELMRILKRCSHHLTTLHSPICQDIVNITFFFVAFIKQC